MTKNICQTSKDQIDMSGPDAQWLADCVTTVKQAHIGEYFAEKAMLM